MEDPWVNAWGDPQKSSSENNSNVPPTTNWASSSKFITDDQADIAIPSWEPEAGTIWDDSPDLHKDLWGGENRVSQLWATPTLDSIGFARPPEEAPSNLSSHSPPQSPVSLQHETEAPTGVEGPGKSLGFEEATIVPDLTHSASDEMGESTAPELNDEIPVEISIEEEEKSEGDEEVPRENSPDADGFGTFEVAIDEYPQSDVWAPSKSDLSQVEQTETWGTSWKEHNEDAGDKGSEDSLDEWELAKRQKEMQDRYVPPDLLDSILRHFDEFAEEYWPDDKSGEPSRPFQHTRNELAESLGITAAVNRLIPPDLTLPIPTPFAKTFVSKEMIDSLKLTRHHLITRNSPLAVYMNSKGSLSWEAAIKSKPDVIQADVIPTGWRIMPKEITEQQQSMNDSKKKVTGGLLSFFGRQSTSSASVSGATSPVRSNTPGPASPQSSMASPRPSVDANTGSTAREADATLSATLTAVAEVSGTIKADSMTITSEAEEPVQTPSAVSRFFGRFSRSNRPSSTSARNSIALSSDDLEFLSDIVPNAHDEMDQVDKLDALSNMIRAPPVPSKLPPALAPPPRAPPLLKPLSPPPFVSSRPITPTMQHPLPGSRPNSMRESIENQLFNLDPGFSDLEFQSKHASSETASSLSFTAPSHQLSAPSILPPPLPAPLSPKPAASLAHRSTTQSSVTAPAQPAFSFDDDDFSDFQVSPTMTSAPSMSLDSAFASFTTPVIVELPRTAQAANFDDFGDLVSPEPPQVPDKPKPISIAPPPPPSRPSSIFPPPTSLTPRPPPFKSPSPPKQPSLHDRRSSKQAESHQRTLSLLETAAARGKWPAPPSPLPNAIPPPGSKVEPDLFDMIDDERSATSPSNNPVINPGSSAVLTSSPASSSTALAVPPSGILMNGDPAGGDSRSNLGLSGQSLPAPTVPPPLIPAQFPKPFSLPSPFQSQVQQNPHSQWRIPSPPTPKPTSSSTQALPSMFSTGSDKIMGGSRSTTPNRPTPQQQNPTTNLISSVFNPAAPVVPQMSDTVSLNKGGTGVGSSGGKLSAQDLSFFESL